MTKVKIEDLKVFRTVAGVIGEARAKCELFKLQWVECSFCDDGTVIGSFVWERTPQDFVFWHKIDCGVNPYAK